VRDGVIFWVGLGVLDEGGAEAIIHLELAVEGFLIGVDIGGLGGCLIIDLDVTWNETLLLV